MTQEDASGKPDAVVAEGGGPPELPVVVAAADELYGLPLDEFTAVRNEWVKQARKEGNSDAAAVISKLAKPTTVAWLANKLVRQRPAQIDSLLELGDALRRATAVLDAEQMRQLSAQQHEIVDGLMRAARSLAGAAGQPVSDVTARSLEETLRAAVADEHAAGELARGQHTRALSYGGFPEGGFAAFALGPASAPTTGRADKAEASLGRSRTKGDEAEARRAAEDEAEERRAAEEAEANAELAAEEAHQALETARGDFTSADAAAQAAAQTADRLKEELDQALAARADADRARQTARHEVQRAEKTARDADQKLRLATVRREGLDQLDRGR